MTPRQEIEDAIDAFRHSREMDPLRWIIARMSRKLAPTFSTDEAAGILDDVMMVVVSLFQKGETTPTVATKLEGITKNKVLDFKRVRFKERRLLEAVKATTLPEDAIAENSTHLIEDHEACAEIVHELREMREQNPRYYQVLIAILDGASVSERLQQCFGETVSEVNERKLRERARAKLAKMLARRKEDVS
jgi:hypothetical protein